MNEETGSSQEPVQDRDPEVLYHYTDQRGALGIIQSASLWATKIQYFNDSAEYHLTLQLAETLIQDFARARRYSLHSGANRDALIEEIKSIENANIFVISLSALGDSLSQWRAYGSPSTSFAIGFRRSDLEVIAEAIDWSLFKCVYNPEEHRRLVGKAVRAAMEGSSVEEAGSTLRAQLTELAPRVKHHSFEEEEEWRIVSPVLPEQYEWKFRVGRFTPVPYVTLPTIRHDNSESAIQEVVVGPTPHRELSIMATAAYLRKMEVEARVIASGTTFREW